MTNLWAFLLQTLTVSLTGAVLLTVKTLLRDKLPPRWQYAVWIVLALRIWIPAQAAGRAVLLPLPLWVETLRLLAESGGTSACTDPVQPLAVGGPVPWMTAAPHSATDWLFLLYTAGFFLLLLRYLVSYLRLRALIRARAVPAERERLDRLRQVGERYGLPVCRAAVLPGLPSPMVCGVFRPVLLLPEEPAADAVLLHELLHVKHHDALQNVFWCVCRCLHWCNPFIWYLMDRIGNDLESLCDQRVLERLEGEERRTYGAALLSMTNDGYPRAPGTASVSNGGKNIARRIEAIVRFKKYPKGMALASVCVTAMLLCAGFCPSVTQSLEPSSPRYEVRSGISPLAMNRDLAQARLTRCSTLAGALDAWAKGIFYRNGLYLLAAAGPEDRPALEERLRRQWEENPDNDVWYRLGEEEPMTVYPAREDQGLPMEGSRQTVCCTIDPSQAYTVANLRREADGSWAALLVFSVERLAEPALPVDPEYGALPGGAAGYPVRVVPGEGWTVKPAGVPSLWLNRGGPVSIFAMENVLPPLCAYRAQGRTGTVTVDYVSLWSVKQTLQQSGDALSQMMGWGGAALAAAPDPAARFDTVRTSCDGQYIFGGTEEDRSGLRHLGVSVIETSFDGSESTVTNWENLDEKTAMEQWESGGGSSSNGSSWTANAIHEDWDGILSVGGGHYIVGGVTVDPETDLAPRTLQAGIWWNGQLAETLTLEEVTNGEP